MRHDNDLLRLLNFSHACFIVCSVMFAMSFSSLLPERVARFLGWLIGAIWLVQVVFLDPQFLSWLYMERIGVFDNVRFFRGFYRWLVRLLISIRIPRPCNRTRPR